MTVPEHHFGTSPLGTSSNEEVKRQGRPPSIPVTAYELVFQWHSKGYGARRIVRLLESLEIFSTKSSVGRLLLRQGTYTDSTKIQSALGVDCP